MTKDQLEETPFYLSNLEDMTVAAVKQQAKVWCDQLRAGTKWDNGDGFHNAFHSVVTKDIELTSEMIDELEKRIVDLTLSTTAIDDFEEKYPDYVFDGSLSRHRSEIMVDYHPTGVLAVALAQMGSGKQGPNAGNKLEMKIPCKSHTRLSECGLISAFGYAATDVKVWSTTRDVEPTDYKVIARWSNRRDEGWITVDKEITEYSNQLKLQRYMREAEIKLLREQSEALRGRGLKLVWVTLRKGALDPIVEMHELIGRVKTHHSDTNGVDYSCMQVLGSGYLALAVQK